MEPAVTTIIQDLHATVQALTADTAFLNVPRVNDMLLRLANQVAKLQDDCLAPPIPVDLIDNMHQWDAWLEQQRRRLLAASQECKERQEAAERIRRTLLPPSKVP